MVHHCSVYPRVAVLVELQKHVVIASDSMKMATYYPAAA